MSRNTLKQNIKNYTAVVVLIVISLLFSVKDISVSAEDEIVTQTVSTHAVNGALKSLVHRHHGWSHYDNDIRYIRFINEPFTSTTNIAASGNPAIYARSVEDCTRHTVCVANYTQVLNDDGTIKSESFVVTKTMTEPNTLKTADEETVATYKAEKNKSTQFYVEYHEDEDYRILYSIRGDVDEDGNLTPVIVKSRSDAFASDVVFQTIPIEKDTTITLDIIDAIDQLYGIELYTEADKVILGTGTCQVMFFAFQDAREIDLSKCVVTSDTTSLQRMFDSCTHLESIDLSGFDTSSVENMSQMFSYCQNLKRIDCSSFDTSSCTNMSQMFDGCKSAEYIYCYDFNTAKATSMNNMFHACFKLKYLDLHTRGEIWDVSKVKNFEKMFNLTTGMQRPEGDTSGNTYGLNITGWVTSSATNMQLMFGSCYSEVIDVSTFDVSNVKTLTQTFMDTKVSELAVENWNTASLETAIRTFEKCYATNFDLRNWDVSHLTTTDGMFNSCHAVNINCAGWNTVSLTNMKTMFSYCSLLESIDVSGWDTRNVTNVNSAFIQIGAKYYQNPRIEVLDLSDWELTNPGITSSSVSKMLEQACVKVIYSPKDMGVNFIALPSANTTTGASPWYAHLDDRYVDEGYAGFAQLILTTMLNRQFMTDYIVADVSFTEIMSNYLDSEKSYVIATEEAARSQLNTAWLQPACRYDKTPSEAPVALWKLSAITRLYYNKNYMHYAVADMLAWSSIVSTYAPFTVDVDEYGVHNGIDYITKFNVLSEIKVTSQLGYDGTVPQYAHFDITGLLHYTEDDWVALSEAIDGLREDVASKQQSIGYTLDIPENIALTIDNYGVYSNNLTLPLCTLKSLNLVEDDDYITFSIGDHNILYTVADCDMDGDFDMRARVFINESRTSNNFLPSVYETPLCTQMKITKLALTSEMAIYSRVLGYTGTGTADNDFGFMILPATSASGVFDFSYTVDRVFDKIFVGLIP